MAIAYRKENTSNGNYNPNVKHFHLGVLLIMQEIRDVYLTYSICLYNHANIELPDSDSWDKLIDSPDENTSIYID